MLKVLIACEESQTSCMAFRELGCLAFSCDIMPCSGGHPDWHVIAEQFFNYINFEKICLSD